MNQTNDTGKQQQNADQTGFNPSRSANNDGTPMQPGDGRENKNDKKGLSDNDRRGDDRDSNRSDLNEPGQTKMQRQDTSDR